MFSNSLAVVVTPKWSRKLLPFWGRYIDGWEGIFSFGEMLTERNCSLGGKTISIIIVYIIICKKYMAAWLYLSYCYFAQSWKDTYTWFIFWQQEQSETTVEDICIDLPGEKNKLIRMRQALNVLLLDRLLTITESLNTEQSHNNTGHTEQWGTLSILLV